MASAYTYIQLHSYTVSADQKTEGQESLFFRDKSFLGFFCFSKPVLWNAEKYNHYFYIFFILKGE